MKARAILTTVLLSALGIPSAATEKTVEVSDNKLFKGTLEASYQAYEFYGPVDDVEAQERVRRIGYELANKARFSDFPFTFFVVDMPVPNAFALPGGEIFVTSGMLDLGLDDDMLACLLGHEIAHVVHRHGTRMQKRAALIGLLSQALAIGVLASSDDDRRPDPADPYSLYGIRASDGASKAETTAAVSLVLGQLLVLNYSREFETESDDEGQRLAAAAGYDPDGARRLWKKMLERIPLNKAYGYWRTHPFEDSRMRAAEGAPGHNSVLAASKGWLKHGAFLCEGMPEQAMFPVAYLSSSLTSSNSASTASSSAGLLSASAAASGPAWPAWACCSAYIF